ncbi:MAG: proline--tRNA ligase [Phycisphaeraceae bacterium]|nr:proline--tRNA ligase [Phycisphaeraceae bacterium]
MTTTTQTRNAESARSTITTRRRGDVQRWSLTLIPTTKEAPADAEAPSHKLLVRAGFIRRVGAGIYDYLPLAWRTLGKISDIIRQEMNAAGACEMLMPAMEPLELFADTKRDIDYGDNLFRVTDRHGRANALAPTHEEVITELMKGSVASYKQLPLNLYQIQTKFRDEFRPRSGLLRGREFIMKDAYSFHMKLEGAGGLDETYEKMRTAYTNTFTRCGLDFSVVEAEAGPIGGSASHEFMVNCETGEDIILKCPETGYAANVEKCEIGHRPHDFSGDPTGDLEKVHTPKMASIEDVSRFMKVKSPNMLKTIVLARSDEQRGWVVAVVRGDHEVNEGKVKDAVGFPLAMADEAEAKAAGFAIGFVSPRAARSVGALLVVDPDAAQGTDRDKGKPSFWATGADEVDHHVKHFNWRRDMGEFLDSDNAIVADIRNARAGDPSPRAVGAALTEGRGVEVGHIFKLGTKYSRAMGFLVQDESGDRNAVIMGCYGIGVSRTLAACVEMSHDDNGIVWPMALAPYHALVTVMKVDNAEHMAHADRIAGELADAGFDVLIDDRDDRPGSKFKDADLIGIPIRLTLGDKALEQGGVEFKLRTDPGKGEVVAMESIVGRCLEAANAAEHCR